MLHYFETNGLCHRLADDGRFLVCSLGELQVRTYHESQGKLIYVVREVLGRQEK